MSPTAPALATPLDLHDTIETRISGGVQLILSRLATTPLTVTHVSIPLDMRDVEQIAAIDVLCALWSHTPAVRRLEHLGGTASAARSRDRLTVSLTAPRPATTEMLKSLAALVDLASPPVDVFDQTIARCTNQAALVNVMPAARSNADMWATRYTQTPLAVMPAPPQDSFTRLRPDSIAAQAHQLNPHGTIAVIVGDIDTHELTAKIHDILGPWTNATTARRNPFAHNHPIDAAGLLRAGAPRIRHTHIIQAATHVRLIADSLPLHHPQAFTTASLASMILAGNFSSRINTLIREQLGLAYRTGGALQDIHDDVFLVVEADITPGTSALALHHISQILNDLADNGPTDEEIERAVRFIAGNYELNLGSQSRRAACLMSCALIGDTLEDITRLPETLASVSSDAIKAVYSMYRPDRLWGVVNGPDTPPKDTPLNDPKGGTAHA